MIYINILYCKKMNRIKFLVGKILGIGILWLFQLSAFAQGGGVAGISAADTEIRQYIDPAGNLILAIGAVVGIIGGVRVYIKWNTGDQDVMKSVMGWGSACIFLVLVALVIKAFFGV
jgi:hypothetical protein